ncbi:MAG: ankyrin repeat domain-containing protein [Burkholderiaceae bacterium]|nr:ankyrin repeat domain-containing protein [Burkholderiaceae bacterium]
MSEPTPRPNDPLRDAWRAASRLDDDSAPSPRLRARILAEARRGRDGPVESSSGERRPHVPANDARWRISAIASVAAIGLAAMLAWQVRHGPPGEPERTGTSAAAPAEAVPAPAGEAPPERATREVQRERPTAATPPIAPPRASDASRGRATHDAQPDMRREQAEPAGGDRPQTQARAPAAPESAAAAAPAPPASAMAAKAPTAAVMPAPSLAAAAAQGDLDGIRRALADGAAIEAPDAEGVTPLIAAIRAGRIEAVRLLLEAGADPNRSDADAITPLQHARARSHAPIAELLIAAGAR